ncbi:MAG: hypothetical protein KDB07_02620 [Planctomycetes bacterium]|nr:hypothetical protein [Planctomycetota bacterium]
MLQHLLRVPLIALGLMLCLALSYAQEGEGPKPDEKKADEKAQELPEGWEWVDLNSLKDEKLWHAPLAKGEMFGWEGTVVASESGEVDPFWNLRAPNEWIGRDLWSMPAGRRGSLKRNTTLSWPSMHKASNADWTVIHTPNAGMHMRFVAPVKGNQRTFETLVVDDSRSQRQPKTTSKLPNLSDSFRIGHLGTLFRVFPGAGNEAGIHLYTDSKGEYSLEASYQPEGYKFVSRPHWVFPSLFVVVRAKSLQTKSVSGKTFASAYLGDCVAVEVLEGGKLKEHLLATNIEVPADTVMSSLLKHGNFMNHVSALSLIEQKGEMRRVRRFDFESASLPTSADSKLGFSETSSPWVHGLRGMWVAEDTKDLRYLLGKRPAAIHQGKFAFTGPEIGDYQSAICLEGLAVVFLRAPKDLGFPKGATAWRFDQPGRWSFDSEQMAKSMVPRSEIERVSPAVKRFSEVFAERGKKRLSNMVLAYKSEITIDAKEIKNKQGSMLELWKRPTSRSHEALRSEDNLDGGWQVRSLVKDKLYQASDESPKLELSRLSADRLQQQLRVRHLLNFAGLSDDDETGARWLWRDQIKGPFGKDGAELSVTVDSYIRHVGNDEYAVYHIPCEGEARNPIAVELTFQLGDRRSRGLLTLKDYTTIPDLSGNDGQALMIPAKIEGLDPKTLKTDFTLTLITELERKTYADGKRAIRSGYNWNELDDKDFTNNFALGSK